MLKVIYNLLELMEKHWQLANPMEMLNFAFFTIVC